MRYDVVQNSSQVLTVSTFLEHTRLSEFADVYQGLQISGTRPATFRSFLMVESSPGVLRDQKKRI